MSGFQETPSTLPTANDPTATYLNANCFEFLLIELVPMAYRLEAERAVRDEEWVGRIPVEQTNKEVDEAARGRREAKIMSGLGVGGIGGSAPGCEEEELREGAFWRLDEAGFRVGQGLAERFTRDKPRFTDPLDVIKFLCKDLWTILFRKQIDNLKTNHRGIYVLTDNTFLPLKRISLDRHPSRARETQIAQAQPFLFFPCGVIRGALASLGVVATVQAESADLPSATFQIRVAGVK